MAGTDPKSYLWANLCALMREDDPSIDAVKERVKVGRGTVQRLKEGETDFQINTLTQLADAFGLKPWQLLIPNLDPDRPPRLEGHPVPPWAWRRPPKK